MSYKICPICELVPISDNEERCSVCSPKVADTHNDSKTFYSMGLAMGDTIEFILEPKYKAVISGERTVRFENKEWRLTPLMQYLGGKIDKKLTTGSGFECFRYDDRDKNLYTRWEKLNKKQEN